MTTMMMYGTTTLDVAPVNAHARNVHEDEVDSLKQSRCVDNTVQGEVSPDEGDVVGMGW